MEESTLNLTDTSRSREWFAVNTRYRFEKKVDRLLRKKGYESYLPLYEKVSYWSDRKKKIQEPLFSNYLFVNIDLRERLGVLQTDGVLNFICFENKPVSIPENQIEMVRNLLQGRRKVEAIYQYEKGQRVRVTCGPMNGMEGIFLKSKDQYKIIISLDHLDQSIAVEIDSNEVMPI